MRDFGRVFLTLNYTDIIQNTYVQSRRVTETMAREKCGRHRCRRTVGRPWRHTCPMRLPDQLDMLIQWPWRVRYSELVTCELQTCLLFSPTWNIAICILCTARYPTPTTESTLNTHTSCRYTVTFSPASVLVWLTILHKIFSHKRFSYKIYISAVKHTL